MEFLGDSTCVAAAGWKAGELCIQFQDGSIYTYQEVSQQVWVAMKRSTSKGWYFNVNIRNNYSWYPGEPMETHNIDQKYFEDILDTAVQATEEEAGL